MRLAMVGHEFAPDVPLGGTGRYSTTLAEKLRALGHEVHVFAFGRSFAPVTTEHDYRYAGIPVRRIVPPAPSLYESLHSNEVEMAFERWLDSIEVDLVHFQHTIFLGMGLPEVAKARGLKVVMTLHDFWLACHRRHLVRPGPHGQETSQCAPPVEPLQCARCVSDLLARAEPPEGLLPFLSEREALGRRAIAVADLVVCGSGYTRRVFEQHLAWPGRYETLPFGIEPFALEPRSNDASRPITFGFLGNITPLKGLHVLLEAFRPIASEARLLVFGELRGSPTYNQSISEAAAALPSVSMLGGFDARDLPRILSQLDAMVVPSVHESFGLTVLEAQAAGIPVIASDVGGLAETVTDGVNGLLFPPGDATALTRALTTLLQAPEKLRDLRSGVTAPLTVDRHVDLLLERYQAVLAGASEPAEFRVSIILPFSGDAARALRCLESIARTAPDDWYEVILVADGATEDAEGLLAMLEGDVAILRNPAAVGWSSACLQGAASARGQYLMFWNQALEALPGWLEPLVSVLDERSEVTAVRPRIVRPEGSPPIAEQVPPGSALLIRRTCFEAMGGFEAGGWDDLDRRLQERGHSLVHPSASCSILQEP